MQVTASDSQLVLAARDGDREAFATLLDRHRSVLLALCRRMLGDALAAEDAAHEAILQALLCLERLRLPEKFGPWLCGIGLNVCRRWRRESWQECWSLEALVGGRFAPEPPDMDPDPATRAELAELADRVRSAVLDLPEGQRTAVLLFYLSGLTYAETAGQLGVEVGAVKTRLHKARRSLRRQLWSEWRDGDMTVETDARMVEMRVADVRRARPTEEAPPEGSHASPAYWVVLEELDGTRKLLIWIGQFEGTAIALLLNDVVPPRPMTHAFAAGLLQALNGRVREVRITRLTDEVFYAEVVVEGPAGLATVDARPSDALALALTAGAPIRVDAEMLARVQPGDAPAPETSPTPEETEGAREIVEAVKATWQK